MFEMSTLLILIPALPLLAAIITAALGRRVLGKHSHCPAVAAIGLSCVCSLLLVMSVLSETEKPNQDGIGYEFIRPSLWSWAHVDEAIPLASTSQSAGDAKAIVAPAVDHTFQFAIDISLRADPLTAIMLAMVTFISTLVAVYSIGYMHDDPGYARFFATVSLFVFSMTMLVSCSNFILLYVFWEAVGMCSYLLIGFWFRKPEAAAAGKKAFLVNRVGDFGFALAVFLIWTSYGTLDFHDQSSVSGATTTVAETSGAHADGVLGQTRLADNNFVGGATGTAICLLLLLGACGKSAQFPLHVWLPDAMEGPTPVSALIHAATMVTAGIYMITRCTPLFMASPDAQLAVACVGGFTALMAGIIAVTQTDLKRVLAYSTVSQLGYMFLALGTGSLAGIFAGMFHLFTHAFFKALLFLGAGSVMHAMGGEIDMRRFGGLRRLMPVTCWTFLAGSLALSGIFPLSGFWSKDAIIAAVHEAADEGALYHDIYHYLYLAALAAALLTAFYTFRAFFMTFFGEQRIAKSAGHHAHESPRSMTVPLIILAVFAIGVGGLADHRFLQFIRQTPSLAVLPEGSAGEFHLSIAVTSGVIALLGIGLAAFLYLGDRKQADWLAGNLRPLYQLSYRKLYIDEIYNGLIVWPLRLAASVAYAIDRLLVDGLVDLIGRLPPRLGAMLRPLQNGLIQFYALAMMLGLLVLVVVMMVV